MSVSDTSFMALEYKVDTLTRELQQLKTDLTNYQTQSAASAEAHDLSSRINIIADDLSNMDAKLALVKLPSETQYYLKENDIRGLKSVVDQARALKAYVDSTLKGILAVVTKMEQDRNS